MMIVQADYFVSAAGIGIVFGSLVNSVARNLSVTKQLFGHAILGVRACIVSVCMAMQVIHQTYQHSAS